MNTPNFVSNLLAIQDKLYQFACRLTANVDAARDLLQETSLAVLKEVLGAILLCVTLL